MPFANDAASIANCSGLSKDFFNTEMKTGVGVSAGLIPFSA